MPERTDDELETLAEITPGDVEDARVLWREHARRQDRDLIDATEEEE